MEGVQRLRGAHPEIVRHKLGLVVYVDLVEARGRESVAGSSPSQTTSSVPSRTVARLGNRNEPSLTVALEFDDTATPHPEAAVVLEHVLHRDELLLRSCRRAGGRST